MAIMLSYFEMLTPKTPGGQGWGVKNCINFLGSSGISRMFGMLTPKTPNGYPWWGRCGGG